MRGAEERAPVHYLYKHRAQAIWEWDTELIREGIGGGAERQEDLATVSQVAQDWAQKTHRGRTELGEWGSEPTYLSCCCRHE